MKRRKTIRAGSTVYDVVYTVPNPRDSQYVRKKMREVSARAIALCNCSTATRKLELLMAENFAPGDLVVTLTYRADALPPTYKAALPHFQRFARQLRQARARKGEQTRYIHIPEGLHGDHRLHHHMILNATADDLEVLRSLWPHGDQIELRFIRDKNELGESGYAGWAAYFSKERREAALNGTRMFTPSRNLRKPVVSYGWVEDSMTVEAPLGATDVVESSDRNEYASFKYVKYTLSPARQEKQKKDCSKIAGSKSTITYRKGLPKKRKPDRQEDKLRVYS